jgi:hypothetical protein
VLSIPAPWLGRHFWHNAVFGLGGSSSRRNRISTPNKQNQRRSGRWFQPGRSQGRQVQEIARRLAPREILHLVGQNPRPYGKFDDLSEIADILVFERGAVEQSDHLSGQLVPFRGDRADRG